MQPYADVSADDLIAYIESVIGKTPDALTDAPTTPLGDAQPFEYEGSAPLADLQQQAGVFLTPAEEAECEMQFADQVEGLRDWFIEMGIKP
ncbi:hypothetical protein WKR88_20520 [Trinickia caryophylli]|uniref:Uncharacterized protein n=1 Tax=Trinickia caryophylli TaxID=28094 RepID=A0A1X7F3E6_TRICW|nr:hypothetical protein [Trinickia caryophylli]WQE13208.1 hypothetical protein U0034_07455 [Trinickia caryophylli]GLU34481.1 hypothetical protein Busp01_43230 [Trinickia caryophylli]SMF44929.1 hypothetical protein SAMN06295900_10788 [Trinickia caryophylli]